MDAVDIARIQAAGRVVVGAVLIANPRSVTSWVGKPAKKRQVRVLTRALGARDAALGAGALFTAADPDAAGPWLVAGMAADAVDCAATLAGGDALPPRGRIGVAAVAAGSALLGGWLAAKLS